MSKVSPWVHLGRLSQGRRGALARAVKEVVVWQLAEATDERALSKTKLVAMLKTSRS